MSTNRGKKGLLAMLFIPVLFLGCKDFSFFSELGVKDRLTITPQEITLVTGATVDFAASGGKPPYHFEVRSGSGSIDPATGAYLAPSASGVETVQVVDFDGNLATATITVNPSTGGLILSPSAASLAINSSLTFIASGGVPPYSFDLAATGSGTPTIDPGTGEYRAGDGLGQDSVRVTDDLGSTRTATVDVTGVVTNVNYTVAGVNFPATGSGGTSIPGGYDFTIKNVGTARGNSPVSYWVYLSADDSLGSGDTLLCSSAPPASPIAALAAGAVSSGAALTGTWPAMGGLFNLFIMISATDDLDTGDNTAGPYAVSLTAPPVNYRVHSVTPGPETIAGAPMTGDLVVENISGNDGGQSIQWTVFASLDAAISAEDTIIDSGSQDELPAGTSSGPIPFSGYWPYSIVPKSYHLLARIYAADDTDPADDLGDSGLVAVSPPGVNYKVATVSAPGGTFMPGGAVNGQFSYQNVGSANGNPNQKLSYAVYASLNTSVDETDTFVASGSGLPALDTTDTPYFVPFAGVWPLDYGSYYLIVQISCAEDVDPGNDQGCNPSPTAVGLLDEAAHEPNNDYLGLTDFYDLGVTFKPGMSIRLTGTMSAADLDDIVAFNTGDCSMITFAVTYASAKAQIRIFVMDGPNSFVDGVSGTPGAISLNWTVLSADRNKVRYLNLDNRGDNPPYNSGYTCVITGD
jgi:hypothetical protein